LRLGCGPRLCARPDLRTYDTRTPFERRHLSVSLTCVLDILTAMHPLGIFFYRLASQVVPVLSSADLPAFWRQLEESDGIVRWLGRRVAAWGIRLTAHPALDVQFGSADPTVVDRSTALATAWAALMDSMNLGPEGRVVVHMGGGGDARACADRFLANVSALPPKVRGRLALENDERLCPLDLALRLSGETGIPIVWDYLHWRCQNPGGDGASQAFAAAAATWPAGVRPKVHFSSPSTRATRQRLPAPREHADLIDPFAFIDFATTLGERADCDIMLEARSKDIALLKLRSDLERLGYAELLREELLPAIGA